MADLGGSTKGWKEVVRDAYARAMGDWSTREVIAVVHARLQSHEDRLRFEDERRRAKTHAELVAVAARLLADQRARRGR